MDTVSVGYAIAAIGALGTAAFGLVDALKLLPGGGISHSGYKFIAAAVRQFFPHQTRGNASRDVKRVFDTLHGNWINGRPMDEQKAIAKSLIKLRLDASTAPRFAAVTDVDAGVLTRVGEKMTSGTQLSADEMNALGRFDLGLAAILDDGYQHADQRYRNSAKVAAMLIAVVLAEVGAWMSFGSPDGALMAKALLAGLVATPLAPIAKDVASALQAGAKVAASLKR